MTPEDFARGLAACVAASLPDGFAIETDGALVTVEAADGSGLTTALDLDADDTGDADAYAVAAEAVLSLVQDFICETLDTTWPGGAGGLADLPIPGARAEGRELQLWYGEEDAPVLRLRPLRL